MSPIRKAEPRQPGQINNPQPKESQVILPDDRPARTDLVLLFRVDEPEQAEALHAYRAAFAGASDIEAVTEDVFALIVRPGVCGCGGGAA